MRDFDLSLLSKYRNELMGFSAILILICHSTGNGITMPRYLSYLLAQGQIGVDIFLFLSGMGLWFSLYKFYNDNSLCQSKHCIKRWYSIRYTRLFVPYLIIIGGMTTVECVMKNETLWFWLSKISTLEYWLSHRASWFVALLIPLYFITPIIFRLFTGRGTTSFVFLTIICYFIALIPDDTKDWTLFKNIQFAVIRVPDFLFGMYLASMIKEGKHINFYLLIAMLVGACIILCFAKKMVYTYLFIIIPLMYFICRTFSLFDKSKYTKLCSFFGVISLESYLWNTTLAMVIAPLMNMFNIPDYNNIVMYLFVIFLGTVLSVFVHKVSAPIIEKCRK